MSIQNSINQALGIGALVSNAEAKEAKEDVKFAKTDFDTANKEAEAKYQQLTKVSEEAKKLGIEGEGELSKLAMSAEQEREYQKRFGEQGLIGAKKLKERYINQTVNAEKDFSQYQSEAHKIQQQIDKANELAEAKREAQRKQQEALTVRFADNSKFQLSEELMARAQIKENK